MSNLASPVRTGVTRFLPLASALLLAGCTSGGGAASPHAQSNASGPEAPPLELAVAQSAVQSLVLEEPYFGPAHVLAVTAPVQGWAVAALRPPYREFPNAVVFRFDGGEWRPLQEGLLLGIQPNRSPLLDLHTVGMGTDVFVSLLDRASSQGFDERFVAKGEAVGVVSSVYRHFFHTHLAGAVPYRLDRRHALDMAVRLFGAEYGSYPRDTCIMFDTPELTDVSLVARPPLVVLKARTHNGQLWNVRWRANATTTLEDKVVDATWVSRRDQERAVAQEEPPVVRWAGSIQRRWLTDCECFRALGFASRSECVDRVAAKLVPNECVRNVMTFHPKHLACQNAALDTFFGCATGSGCAATAYTHCVEAYDAACAPSPELRDELAACSVRAF